MNDNTTCEPVQRTVAEKLDQSAAGFGVAGRCLAIAILLVITASCDQRQPTTTTRGTTTRDDNSEQLQGASAETAVYYGTYYGGKRTVLKIYGDTAIYTDLDGRTVQLTRNEKGAYEGSSFGTGHIVARPSPMGGYMIGRH